MQFNLGSNERPISASNKSIVSAMADAANGKTLPGRLGLIQSLCNVWASPIDSQAHRLQKVVWVARSAFASLGVWRAYQESTQTVAVTPTDPWYSFIKEHDLSGETHFDLVDLLYTASKSVPYEDLSLKDTKDYIVRKFTPARGPAYYFKVFSLSDETKSYASAGPLFTKHEVTAGGLFLQNLLWAQFASHNIRLSVNETSSMGYAAHTFELADAGHSDPYISDTTSEEWTNARVYANRCRAFMARGLVRGVLFYGPPGTGKTSLAMNVLGDAGRVLKITASAVARSDFGSITRLIETLNPRVILFDDIDRFTSGDLSRMLEYMEQLKRNPPPEGRIIVGTVNAIEMLDPALLRAGRFDEVLAVPEPGPAQRLALTRHYITFFGNFASGLDPQALADKMDGFSPADIRSILESVSCVGAEHLEAEIARTTMQRKLFTGTKVHDYLRNVKHTEDDGLESPPKGSG